MRFVPFSAPSDRSPRTSTWNIPPTRGGCADGGGGGGGGAIDLEPGD